MIGPSKILTVSYGTFSCTLEGFDDPFNTMKAIAEYFRDLAAGDRYFGAEPPIPDAAMLHKIAEREIQRRVEAKIQENGVILRVGDAMSAPSRIAESGAGAVTATANAVAPFAPVTSTMSPGPSVAAESDAGPETAAQRLARLRAPQTFAPAPVISAPQGVVTVDLYAEDQDVEPAAASVSLAGRHGAPDDSGLDRMAADLAAADLAELAEPDGSDEALTENTDGLIDTVDQPAPIRADQPSPPDLTAFSDQSAAATASDRREDEGRAGEDIRNADLEAGADAVLATSPDDSAADGVAAAAEPTKVEEADEAAREDFAGEDLTERLMTDSLRAALATPVQTTTPLQSVAAPTDETLDLSAILNDSIAASLAESPVAAEARLTEEWVDDDVQAEQPEAEQPEADVLEADVLEADVLDDVDLVSENLAADDLAILDLASDAWSVDDTAAEIPDADLTAPFETATEGAETDENLLENHLSDGFVTEDVSDLNAATGPAAAHEALPPEIGERLQRARARVIKIRRADAPALVIGRGTAAAVSPPVNVVPRRPASPSAGADAQRDAAALAAPAEPQLDPEAAAALTAALTNSAPNPSTAVAVAKQTALSAQTAPIAVDALARLMAETNTALEVPETRRRQSAIAHLKAAVAATIADRQVSGRDKAQEVDAKLGPYRKDLEQVVGPAHPGEPILADRPPPLVLVSSQRINRQKPDVSAQGTHRLVLPVRPRRISASAPVTRPVSLVDYEEEDEIAEAAGGAPQNIFTKVGAQSFPEFAERLGLTSMPEILEAAAAYCALVLGREQFSRPLLLETVAGLPGHEATPLEESLRGFGILLRDGRITKVRRGQFQLAQDSHVLTEARRLVG